MEVLHSHGAFSGLSPEDLVVLASRAKVEALSARTVLFRHGDEDPWMHCLVEGTLALRAADGREHEISAGTPEAGRIISRLKPRRYTATAVTPVKLIRIDGSDMGYWHTAVDPSTVLIEEISDAAYMPADELSPAGTEVATEDFQLPSMPAIAIKARELIDRDDCDADMVARVLLNDPSMTAKLIKAANSPVFYGSQCVSTCTRAVTRLGLRTTRHLIMSFAVRELFDIKVPSLAAMVKELWDHSTEVAAIACVLAKRTRSFDPGEAQLAGLLHDIGVVPVLHLSATQPQLSADPDAVLAMVSTQRAAIGRQVLEGWHFPAPLVNAAADAEDWWRDPGPQADLSDLVNVAQLLSFIGKQRIVDVPPVVRLPAFRKLLGDGVGPDGILTLLDEASEQVAEVRSLLRT